MISVEEKMQKAINFFEDQLKGITPVGCTTSLIDSIKVTAYNQQVQIKDLGSISQKDRRITINVFDINLTEKINKALQSSSFHSYIFSKDSVVVNLPEISGDSKKEIKKRIKSLGEEAKIAIRNIRREYRKQIPDDKSVEKVTQKANSIIDDIVDRKCSYI